MPDINRINLTRSELEKFLPTHKSIKAFEQVLENVSETLPSAIAAAELNAGAAGAAAYAALAQLVEVADLLMLMLSGPLPVEPQEADDLQPRVQSMPEQDDLDPRLIVGTLSAQNSDGIEVTGGTLTDVTVNGVTITQPATGATLTLADTSSLITAGAYASTFTFTGATSVTFPTSGTLAASTVSNWTPTDASGAGLVFAAGTAGISIISDKFVFVSARVVYPVTADASQATIGSLPAICGVAGQPKYNAAGTVIGGGTANKIGTDRGSANAYMYTTGSTAATNAGQSGQTLDFSFCYLTV